MDSDIHIDWKLIDPIHFEKVCYFLLDKNGFSDIRWYGKSGGDKGRDLVASKLDRPVESIERLRKWVIQCKRYIESPPSKTELSKFLVSAREHKPDAVLIVLTNTLSSGTKDWLESVKAEYDFEIYIWEELDLVREIHKYQSQLSSLIPPLHWLGTPFYFAPVTNNRFEFYCQEAGQVSLIAFNCKDAKEAVEKARNFVTFLKQNDVEFIE